MIRRIKKVKKDGDCLYNCFIGITGMHNTPTYEMRKIISNWINTHRDYFVKTWGEAMRQHLKNEGVLNSYRKDYVFTPGAILDTYIERAVEAEGQGTLTYGGDIEIDAFAQAFGYQVEVYQYYEYGYEKVNEAHLNGQFSPANEFPDEYPNPNLPHWQIIQSRDHFDYVTQPPTQPAAASSQEPARSFVNPSELRRLQAERKKRTLAAQKAKEKQDMNNRIRDLSLHHSSSQKPVALSPPAPPPAPATNGSRRQEESELRQIHSDAEEARRLQQEFDDESLVRQIENAELRRRFG